MCYVVVADNAMLLWVWGGSGVCLMIVWLVTPIAIISICPGLVYGIEDIHMNSFQVSAGGIANVGQLKCLQVHAALIDNC